jgi:ubiquinone/menaquinone biosynthesis C-methylase UbiE
VIALLKQVKHKYMSNKPLAYEAYQILADDYSRLIDTKPHNAYYERPATLALLPNVKGMQVLDAGCGPGAYADAAENPII